MKETILKVLNEVIGKGIGGIILRIVIAILLLFTGSSTDVGDAIAVAIDKERAIAAAVELINETPKAEIVEAVKENPIE